MRYQKSVLNMILTVAAAGCSLFLLSGCQEKGRDSVQEQSITSFDIVIPGLSREYDFLFLTDTHVIIPDEKEEQQVKDYAKQRRPVFESAQDNAARIPRLSEWVDYANKRSYDGLLLGGDIIDFPSSANLKYLDACLKELAVPWLYTPGNHDWTYPWEYMTEKGKESYLALLAPYMDGNPAVHTLEYDDLILVALDDSSNQISPDALESYREILTRGKPVIVLLHVPLYTESLFDEAKQVWSSAVTLGGGIHGGIYPDETSTEFLRLTLAKDSPVVAVLAGHVHFSQSSMLIGEKSIPQITGDAGFHGKAAGIHVSGAGKNPEKKNG